MGRLAFFYIGEAFSAIPVLSQRTTTNRPEAEAPPAVMRN